MATKHYTFAGEKVSMHFDTSFSRLSQLVDRRYTIIITDENVYRAHLKKFKGWSCIVLKPGEEYKIQPTVDAVIGQLITMQADRSTTLVGVGGGVITDLTGYIASVYMRGLRFGFVPTSLLGMVDASIGGKNGIDVGEYKNMVGVIRQPEFILYDTSLLSTLPDSEWSNGCAEIIKHACINDARLFKLLQQHDLASLRRTSTLLKKIIRRNVEIKSSIVGKDVHERGDRRLLNFGHTLGHALETQYELMHGQAVALGMVFAGWLSEHMNGTICVTSLESVLVQYGLPTRAQFDVSRVFKILQMDKKRERKKIRFVSLKKLGKGTVVEIDLAAINGYLKAFTSLNRTRA
ncbi:MAG: 3-dehydroquinate synthase [Bacteroidetes bacterium]|nr:3-dehydroquinate synthase [Bacteroidota bacterium]